jgi:hypothetical protein
VSGVPFALADGDPASDVLTTYPLFNPTDASVPAATAARLEAVLAASAKAGFPVRVALINSATDLGTATKFWYEKPSDRAKNYSAYLGYELSGMFHGQVLTVMPGGYGLYPPHGHDAVTSAEQAVALPSPSATDLAKAALIAVPALAKADGHPLPPSSEIHVAAVQQSDSDNGWAIWTSVVVGLILIGICWGWSVKARPLRDRADTEGAIQA